MVLMVFMQIGEVIFGGVGSGLYGMLLYCIIAVFLAGLMVGRTPEYLGRKIEAREVTLAVIGFLVNADRYSGVQRAGHDRAQCLGRHSRPRPAWLQRSALRLFQRDGQQRLGLWRLGGLAAVAHHRHGSGDDPWPLWDYHSGAGDCGLADPQNQAEQGHRRHLPTHGPLFVTLLILTVLILGALTFFPVLALGPIAEETARVVGQSF